MGECFSHCQISLKLQQGLGDLSFGNLMDGAGVAADQGVNGVEPALFVAHDRVDAAPAVRERATVSGHHQCGVALGDQLQGFEIAAERIPVESTLECDRGSDGREDVVAGEQEPVCLRPQADVAE